MSKQYAAGSKQKTPGSHRVPKSPFSRFPPSSPLPLTPLARSFYLRPTLLVARELLGKLLVRRINKRTLIGRIVEVEAYLGERDPASHAYRGETQRNSVMFREGGYLYVYFTYGMHFCCNVVTESAGIGRAVLLRALEPISGIETMAANRSIDIDARRDHDAIISRRNRELTNGPAKLCQALAIARKENGTDLCGDCIWISDGPNFRGHGIVRSRRIGIRVGTERLWRFYAKGNPFVSRR